VALTWKDKTVIRILLLVARIVGEEKWIKDIQELANHISSGIA